VILVDYLWDGGRAAVLVDGIGYAEVERGLERHGLDVAEGVVPQLELGIQRHLLFAACRVLLLRICEFLLLAERHMPPPGFYFAVSLTCVASRLQIYIAACKLHSDCTVCPSSSSICSTEYVLLTLDLYMSYVPQ
jgi:hypothetical protein